jgi:hypothetical protein
MSLKRLWLLVVLLLLMSAPVVLAQEVIEEQGTIDANNREATFDLELSAGETITVTVTATSGDLDPILALLDEGGDVVAQNDDIDTDGGNYNSEFTYTAEADGIYTIHITAFSETAGDFLLTIAYGDFSSGSSDVGSDGDDSDSEGDEERPDLDLTRETEHFIIHYTEDGDNAADSDYVDAAAEIVEQVWQAEIEEMGWPAPPDDGSAGGDERFDMYLMELCGGEDDAYGYAQPYGPDIDNPNTPEVETEANTSFLVVDNDFNDDCFEGGTGDLMTTVAHEFHHNIQFGYDGEDMSGWYYEATGTWMETQVAGDEQQATMYVSDAFQTPEGCFGSSDLAYGEYLFIQSLVDAYGEQIVMELWQNIAQVEGFEALQITLEAYGDEIPTAVARYHLQNLVRAYPLADEFGVTVYLENTIDDIGDWSYTGDGIQEMGANYFAVDLDAANYSAYVNGGDNRDLSLYAIGVVEGDSADVYLLDSNSVFTTDGYDYVYLMIFNWAYDDDLEDCEFLTDYDITVEESEDEPVDVEMTFDASSFEPLGN